MKTKFLFGAVVFVAFVGFNSCGKQHSDFTPADSDLLQKFEQSNDDAFSELLVNVDKLNEDYGYSSISTKGLGKELITYAADKGGAKIGAWAGSRLGAGLGVITANPVVGVAGYLGGRAVGGTAGFVCASYVARIWLDQSSGEMVPINSAYMPINLNLDNFSCGELHNEILRRLMTNGKSYVDKSSGRLLIDEMYSDALSIEYMLGVDDELGETEMYRSAIISYCNDVAQAAKEKIEFNESGEIYNSKILSAIIAQGVPEEEVLQFEQLTSKLTAPVVLNSEQTLQYERDFENLVISSDLPDSKKVDIIITGSVAIMSTEFWE